MSAHGISTALALSAVPVTLFVVPSVSSTELSGDTLGNATIVLLFVMVVLVSLVLNSKDLDTVWGSVEPPQSLVSYQAYRQEDLATLAARYGLTRRESEIALLLANGRSMPYIKDEFCVSLGTVQTHVSHIYRKMDVHNRQEFLDEVAYAMTEQPNT